MSALNDQIVLAESLIRMIRSKQVILDTDLAGLYGVSTKVLNQAVKRNQRRFPLDFMFQLTEKEKAEVVTNCDHLRNLRFSSTLPFAFTEHGVLMLASVLNSMKAVEVSLLVIRVFVKLREMLSFHKELAVKFRELEVRTGKHDEDIGVLFEAIRQLMAPPPGLPKRRIGFHVD